MKSVAIALAVTFLAFGASARATSIKATVNVNGSVLGAEVEMSRAFDRHSLLNKRRDHRSERKCDALGFVSDCYVYAKSLDDTYPTGYYGLSLLFKKPLPAVLYLLGGSGLAFSTRDPSEKRAVRNLSADTREGKEALQGSYAPEFGELNWSYEAVEDVVDGRLIVQLLAELAEQKNLGSNCYNEAPECAAIYEFKADDSRSGYAYCAHLLVGGIRSAPYGCVALYIKNLSDERLAAFFSPFLGEAFLRVSDITCSVSGAAHSEIHLQTSVDTVLEYLRKQVDRGAQIAKTKSGIVYLVAESRYVDSLWQSSRFEYTTLVLHVSSYENSAVINAHVAPSLSPTRSTERSSFLSLSADESHSYRLKFVGILKEALQKAFKQKAECGLG